MAMASNSGSLAGNIRAKFVSRAALPKVNLARLERDFFSLVESGRLNKYDIQALVENGFDLNQLDEDGKPALFHAVEKGHFYIVDSLLEGGADINVVNSQGENVIFFFLELLDMALRNAYRSQHNSSYSYSYDNNSNEMEKYRQKEQDYMNKQAKEYTDSLVAKFQQLVKKGANPNMQNSEGLTPLLEAIRIRDSDGIRALLEIGVDPNAPGASGERPLIALLKDYQRSQEDRTKELIFLLFEKGADIRSTGSNGRSAANLIRETPELSGEFYEKLVNTAWKKRAPLIAMRRRLYESRGWKKPLLSAASKKNNNSNNNNNKPKAEEPRNAWGGKRKTRRGRKGKGCTRKN